MTRAPAARPVVTVRESKQDGILAGPVRVLHPVIKFVDCKFQYDNRRHEYHVPKRYLDEIMVALETQMRATVIYTPAELW
jgi:hypothetical protein